MKLIFHNEELAVSKDFEDEQKKSLMKELEIIKLVNDKRVLKYKTHFFDNGKNLDSPALKKMNSDIILFVEQEDDVNSTLQDFINLNKGKLNDR